MTESDRNLSITQQSIQEPNEETEVVHFLLNYRNCHTIKLLQDPNFLSRFIFLCVIFIIIFRIKMKEEHENERNFVWFFVVVVFLKD